VCPRHSCSNLPKWNKSRSAISNSSQTTYVCRGTKVIIKFHFYISIVCLGHQGAKIDFFLLAIHTYLIRMTCQSYIRESVLYVWFIAVWNVLHVCTRVQRSLIFFFFLLFVMKTKLDDEVNSTLYTTYILLQSKRERERTFSLFSIYHLQQHHYSL
jgi:hypothetical protein